VQHTVVGIRIELAKDGSHRHATGVWVGKGDGPPYTLRQVAESIREGEIWEACVGGVQARIQPVARCPYPNCKLTPYIALRDGDGRNLLDRAEMHQGARPQERNIT
jgi:hypothetical protein